MNYSDFDPSYCINDDGTFSGIMEDFIRYYPSAYEMENLSGDDCNLVILTPDQLKDYTIFCDLFNDIHEKLLDILHVCRNHNINIYDFFNIIDKYDWFYGDVNSWIFQFFLDYEFKIQFKFFDDCLILIYNNNGNYRIVCLYSDCECWPESIWEFHDLKEYFYWQWDKYFLQSYIKICPIS